MSDIHESVNSDNVFRDSFLLLAGLHLMFKKSCI